MLKIICVLLTNVCMKLQKRNYYTSAYVTQITISSCQSEAVEKQLPKSVLLSLVFNFNRLERYVKSQ